MTYSCDAKETELGVKAETIETFGVVSPEVAEEMAAGLAKKTGADLNVSVTGIAWSEEEVRISRWDWLISELLIRAK